MRGNTLFGGLAFAVFASLGAVSWTLVTVPLLWPSLAVGLCVVGAAVAYAVWIAPTWRRGFTAGALTAALTVPLAVLSPGLSELVLGAAVAVAVVRSGFLYRLSAFRALVLEGGLLAAGLLAVRVLAGASSLGVGMGFWGFFLVQSLYFLIGGVRERPDGEPELDPFVRARRQALAILDG